MACGKEAEFLTWKWLEERRWVKGTYVSSPGHRKAIRRVRVCNGGVVMWQDCKSGEMSSPHVPHLEMVGKRSWVEETWVSSREIDTLCLSMRGVQRGCRQAGCWGTPFAGRKYVVSAMSDESRKGQGEP